MPGGLGWDPIATGGGGNVAVKTWNGSAYVWPGTEPAGYDVIIFIGPDDPDTATGGRDSIDDLWVDTDEGLVSGSDLILVDGGSVTYDTSDPADIGVTVTTVWGIDSTGDPYYDPAGAASGDEAALYWVSSSAAYTLVPFNP